MALEGNKKSDYQEEVGCVLRVPVYSPWLVLITSLARTR
jgi:hypothetical protein